ncbi:MAG: amidase [Betaproteobacteria bacterium]|nr:amidase [Betaproteobacteria bacterium]
MNTATALLTESSVELRRRIGSKEISPVELLEACIERIAEINPAVNAVTATCYERARKEAKAAEKAAQKGEPLGLLHGLPTGIKDLEETGGLLTTFGSQLYRDYVPAQDSAMVARVRAAGAIVVCKTNVPEFGAGANSRNVVWGATGNPFNPMLNAGGSSGGSAVALACDMLPVCTGSDTGGSLRIPGAINGVIGFRPSPGLVPVERRGLGWTPISVVGPMGRTVADTCQLLAAQAAMEDCDPLSYPINPLDFAVPAACDLGSLRVAYTEDFGICPVDKPIRKVLRDKVAAMRHLFKSCDEVTFAEFKDADRCFDVIRAANYVAKYRDAYEKDPNTLGANVRANYEIGAKMSLADMAWAHLEETRIFRRFQQTFRDYDVVLAPTTPVSPFPWSQSYLAEMDGKPLNNYYHWLALTYVITLATNPAIALPCGTDQNGMPFGLQVVGRFRGDRELLGAAHAMEQAFNSIDALRRPRPDLAKLNKPTPELKSIVTHPPKL